VSTLVIRKSRQEESSNLADQTEDVNASTEGFLQQMDSRTKKQRIMQQLKQTKQNKTKQNKTKQNQTKQNKTKQNKTKQNKKELKKENGKNICLANPSNNKYDPQLKLRTECTKKNKGRQ